MGLISPFGTSFGRKHGGGAALVEETLFANTDLVSLSENAVTQASPFGGTLTTTGAWDITQVLFYIKHTGASGNILARIHLAGGDNKPTGAALATSSKLSSSISSSLGWVSFPFNSVSLSDSTAYVFSIIMEDNESAGIAYNLNSSADPILFYGPNVYDQYTAPLQVVGYA